MKHRRPHPHKPARQPAELFGQPPQGFYRMPELELRGGYILSDGCRRILDFGPQKLCVDFGTLIVTFYGEDLRIESLTGRRLVAAGKFRKMEFTDKWGDQGGTL